MNRQCLVGAFIVGLIAFAVYAPMLRAGPVWDDVIVETAQMPHFQTVGDAFFPDTGIHEASPNYYRPIVLLSYMVDRSISKALFGEQDDALYSNPSPPRPVQHGSNLFFHALASIFVCLAASELFKGRSFQLAGAVTAGVVFALHPIHAESVCAFTGRSDVLSTLFAMISIWATLRFAEGGGLRWTFVSAGAFFAALLSKEVAFAALGIVPILIWARRKDQEKETGKGGFARWLALGVLWVGAIALYLGLRSAAGIVSPKTAGMYAGSALGRVVRAAGYYTQKALFPWPQVHYVPELPSLLQALVVLVLACFGVWLLVRILPPHRRLIYGLSAVFFVGLVPSLFVAIRTIAATPVAERYLYLPSVALAVMMGLVFGSLLESKRFHRAAIPVGLLVSFALGFSSYRQTEVWQTNLNFWEDVVRDRTAARYALVLSNLGEAYQSVGQPEKAMTAYQRALAPDIVVSDSTQPIVIRNNIGVLKMESAAEQLSSGNPQMALSSSSEAISIFEENLKQLPGAPIIYKALGHSYLIKAKAAQVVYGKLDEFTLKLANRALIIALKLDPQSRAARVDLDECQSLLKAVKQ